jgi:predicted CXXCH cytochrome family protein
VSLLEPADDHPIGVRYTQRRAAGAASLVPASALDSRIQLFDNQVGCNSCHSPFSTEKGLLVMSNERSGLCLSCHRE